MLDFKLKECLCIYQLTQFIEYFKTFQGRQFESFVIIIVIRRILFFYILFYFGIIRMRGTHVKWRTWCVAKMHLMILILTPIPKLEASQIWWWVVGAMVFAFLLN